jgi:hypothetical protein
MARARTSSVHESEFRQRLEDLHRRMQRALRDLDEVRAHVVETAVDVDNRLVFGYLHAQEAWETRRAA